MTPIVETHDLSKEFGNITALNQVTTTLVAGSVVGLVGRNGSGKTTLLHHVTGLALPSAGRCLTFGVPSADLGAAELSRLGVVHQEARLLMWMTVRQHLRYVASFYARWDRGREERLGRLHLLKHLRRLLLDQHRRAVDPDLAAQARRRDPGDRVQAEVDRLPVPFRLLERDPPVFHAALLYSPPIEIGGASGRSWAPSSFARARKAATSPA